MDLESNYEIVPTADFIYSCNFTRVALQFPDELLKDSTRVVRALRGKLWLLRKCSTENSEDNNKDVRLFVMADTTFGSCCVDEVGALHADAECVVHYGHTCLSPTTTLPAFFVFGKASISASNCVEDLLNYASTNGKRVVVLYGLEYAHSIKHIREALEEASRLSQSKSKSEIHFADVKCSVMNPSDDHNNSNGLVGPASDCTDNGTCGTTPANSYGIGGLTWSIPDGQRMEDYLLFWIGSDNSAFANVVMTFNGCDIDMMQQRIVW